MAVEKDNRNILILNQKRPVGIALGIVEDQLRRLEWLIRKGEQQGLFFRISDDIKEEAKPLLQERIERLMQRIGDLKDSFDLTHTQKEWNLSSLVESISLYLRVELENVMSAKLKGYGPVDPELKDLLDPKLREMISLLKEINSMV